MSAFSFSEHYCTLNRFVLLLISFVGLSATAAPAFGAFIFRVGDTVYVDGKEYKWEEWKKIRDDPELRKQAESPAPAQQAAPSIPAGAPRAAACTTAIYYDEFPSEDERFQCTQGLGALTRDQILQKGWKVDFVEKIPPVPGQPAQSPRGLPLNQYKLVISR
jgi:hypothetical protein